MKFICDRANECNVETCRHRLSYDDCAHACQRVAGARCVVDVMSLPEIGDTGTVVIVIPRLRERA